MAPEHALKLAINCDRTLANYRQAGTESKKLLHADADWIHMEEQGQQTEDPYRAEQTHELI